MTLPFSQNADPNWLSTISVSQSDLTLQLGQYTAFFRADHRIR